MGDDDDIERERDCHVSGVDKKLLLSGFRWPNSFWQAQMMHTTFFYGQWVVGDSGRTGVRKRETERGREREREREKERK
jgi:hypothetical protein